MRMMLVLVTLLGLAVHPVMAGAPGDKDAKEFATGNKQSQGKDLKKEHKIAIFGGQREKSLPVLKATEEKDSRP